ncbi:MAG: DUF4167 domain-containing protein [Alphaproteobacteria bacterium]
MRRSVNGKRTRGRPGRNKPSNSRNQTFDSTGPEGKVRGSANQVFEKYLSLARDAQSSGDRIAAENYFQHAEHYYRILNVNAQNAQNAQHAQNTKNAQISQIDRNRAQGNGSGQGGAVPGQGNGPVASGGPAAAKPQPAQPEAKAEAKAEAAEIGAEAPGEAPGGKPERPPKPTSQSGGSPDQTSAKATDS